MPGVINNPTLGNPGRGNASAQSTLVRTLSVIVPLLNERARLPALVSQLGNLNAEQIIFVDGGSLDGSRQWLRQHWEDFALGHCVLESASGRACQMNAGAQTATGDVLLFLHADSQLPPGAKREILMARDRQSLWGRFDIAFDGLPATALSMRVIALFINIRSRLTSICTGDQAIFVDRLLFQHIGGYAQIPLMEDVALSKVLKRQCVPHCSRLQVSTSARRWEQYGVVRTVLLMWYLRSAYFCGVSAHRLAARYRQAQ